jgi:hypothetical protein
VCTFESTNPVVEVSADDQSKVYGEPDPELTWSITDGALEPGDTLEGIRCRVDGSPGGISTREITCDEATTQKYVVVYRPGQLTIERRPITVAIHDKLKVYGDADPAPTYEVTSGSLVDGDSFSGSLARVPGEGVGSYAITAGALTAGPNYDMTLTRGQLTVLPKPIEITADDKSKVAGDTDPEFTWSITSGALEPGDELSSVACDSFAPHDEPGAYEIACAGHVENYRVTYRGGTLTVAPPPVVSPPEAQPQPPPNPPQTDPEPQPVPEPDDPDSHDEQPEPAEPTPDGGDTVVRDERPPLTHRPRVTLSFSDAARGIRIRALRIRAHRSTRIEVRCAGGGCPFKEIRIGPRSGAPMQVTTVERLSGHQVKAGARLYVRVGKATRTGCWVRFEVRDEYVTRRDTCTGRSRAFPALTHLDNGRP